MNPPETSHSDKEGEDAKDPSRYQAPPQQDDGIGNPPNPHESMASNGSSLNGTSSKDPHDETLNNGSEEGVGSDQSIPPTQNSEALTGTATNQQEETRMGSAPTTSQDPSGQKTNNQSGKGLGSSQTTPPQKDDGSATNQQDPGYGTNTTPSQSAPDTNGNGSGTSSNPTPQQSQNPPKVDPPTQGSDTGTSTEDPSDKKSQNGSDEGVGSSQHQKDDGSGTNQQDHGYGTNTTSTQESRGNQSDRQEDSTREQGNRTNPSAHEAPSANGTSSNPPTQSTTSGTRTNGNGFSEMNGGSNRQGAPTNPPSHSNVGSGHYFPQQNYVNGQGPNTSYSQYTNFVGLGPEGSQGAGYGNHWNPSGYDYYAPPPPMNNFYGQPTGPHPVNGMNWPHPPQQTVAPGWSTYPPQSADYGSWSYQGHRRVLEQVYSEQTDPYGVLWKTVRFQNEPNIVSIPASELLQIQRQNGEITNQNSDPLPPGNNPQQVVNGVSAVGPVPTVQPNVQAHQIVPNIAPVRPQSTTNGPILPTVKREPRAPPKRTVFSPPRNRGRSKSRSTRSKSRARRIKNDVAKIEKTTGEKLTISPNRKYPKNNSAPKTSTSGATTSSNQNQPKKAPPASQSATKGFQQSKKKQTANNSTSAPASKKPPAQQKQSMNKTFTAKEKPKKPAPRSSSQVRTQPPAPKKPSTFTHDELFDLFVKTLDKKIEAFTSKVAMNGQDVVKQKAVLAKLIRFRNHAAQIQKDSRKVANGRGVINVDLREQPEDVQRLLTRVPSYAANETKRIEESLLCLRRLYVESLLVDNKSKNVDTVSGAKLKKWFIDEINQELRIQLKAVKENRFDHVLLLPLYPPKEKKKEEPKEEGDRQKDEKSGGDKEKKKGPDVPPKGKCPHLSCANSNTCLYT